MSQTADFVFASSVGHQGLNLPPGPLPEHRRRHQYGDGPFARLVMPPLPQAPGVYLWRADDEFVYVGQTRTPLRERLGPRGYSSITAYNTFLREVGKRNGGQQTNCRVNALANTAFMAGRVLTIWYRVTTEGVSEEASWMERFGLPVWNRRLERSG
jgi:hypothetical protein